MRRLRSGSMRESSGGPRPLPPSADVHVRFHRVSGPFTGIVHLVARGGHVVNGSHQTTLEPRTLCGLDVELDSGKWKRSVLEWNHPSACKACLSSRADVSKDEPIPLPYQQEA